MHRASGCIQTRMPSMPNLPLKCFSPWGSHHGGGSSAGGTPGQKLTVPVSPHRPEEGTGGGETVQLYIPEDCRPGDKLDVPVGAATSRWMDVHVRCSTSTEVVASHYVVSVLNLRPCRPTAGGWRARARRHLDRRARRAARDRALHK